MKLTVIGGGGVRSPLLAKSLARRAGELGITELVFMDTDAEKLRIYGGIARHVAGLLSPDLEMRLTGDAIEAVRDADYVITTIRVGGDHMRVRDERIALSRNVLGQETTGAAGVSFAMRSVPALAGYCELIREHAKPGAKVFNFTNPAGVVSQALRDMGYDFAYGVCDAPTGMLRTIAAMLGVDSSAISGECYGLNHLSFFSSVLLDGREILPELLADERTYRETDMRYFEPELARRRGTLLNEYLYYFYYRERAVENILRAGITRGEQIEEVNRHMTGELRGLDMDRNFDEALAIYNRWHGRRSNMYMANESGVRRTEPWKFDIYGADEGGYAGVALRYIEIERSGSTRSMILCAPNAGAIPGLADDDVVEVTCDVSKEGCAPHRFAEVDIEPGNLELIRRVKYYERLAARGIISRSEDDIVECLSMHPLVGSYSIAKDLAQHYIELNAEYWGR
ncbi:glycoside hydrolase family 4 [Coriobacterium glomerans PW2]|uniref:Glycoside hydrolase family 4 n=1 Tax=Coriobacterium glomerans (strain ATCC 49209 / DSM 20642 / JCM 10262 / PW2) TaxID=700015 RepID=F2N8A5_CORGP|nr:6-phospho-beta-glucosidase [Coriobacterium glomerans]AEB07288.1 glycoside hydrolase family 4 [Coriobacterium glomerans PW2]